MYLWKKHFLCPEFWSFCSWQCGKIHSQPMWGKFLTKKNSEWKRQSQRNKLIMYSGWLVCCHLYCSLWLSVVISFELFKVTIVDILFSISFEKYLWLYDVLILIKREYFLRHEFRKDFFMATWCFCSILSYYCPKVQIQRELFYFFSVFLVDWQYWWICIVVSKRSIWC